MEKQRLQKVLAAMGLGSRRRIEGWISEGRVRVNGQTASLGDQAGPGDAIEVDGKRVVVPDVRPVRRVLIYHKPEGQITANHDPEGRPTVAENLPPITEGRWITVGRLDFNTSGLLLVTNDGELANRLMHPSYQIERTYAVRVLGGLDDEQQNRLIEGVQLEDGQASFTRLADAGGQGANHWYHVTLHEGRNREVRRMIEAVGGQVSRLIRISYAGVTLPPRLRPGKIQELPPETEGALAELVGLKPETRHKTLGRHDARRAHKPFKAGKPARAAQKRPSRRDGKGPEVHSLKRDTTIRSRKSRNRPDRGTGGKRGGTR
ncbi:23S rRNA pseudouridine(2605) synthase RluB [Guyparkeria sp.]|uniref:23S rRNA pseudouridine(2605) synthase RluB n=1 Tax=Guyparkeria sp. TaxID=2035736 RepID=UPI00397114C9